MAGMERGMRGKGWRQEPFPGPIDLLMKLDKTYIETPALRLLSDELVAATVRREQTVNAPYLALSAPPQEGKSSLVARAFPLWLLLRDPDLRILVISYDDGSSVRWGRMMKAAIRSHTGDEPLNGMRLNLALRPGSEAVNQLELDGYRGGLSCMSLTGGITGKPADCMVGETEVTTPAGRFTIRDVYRAHLSGHPQSVLSWNADTGATEFRPVEAVRRIPDRAVLEITTVAGRVIRCTPEHRVHTPGGWREAALLHPGDALSVRRAEREAPVRGLREGAQGQVADLPGVLQQDQGRAVGAVALRSVRHGVPEDGRRAREAAARWAEGPVLRPKVFRGLAEVTRLSVQGMWQADGIDGSASVLLLNRVQADREAAEPAKGDLQGVRRGVCGGQFPAPVLWPKVLVGGALEANDRNRQLVAHPGEQLPRVLQADAPVHLGSGSGAVPGMRHPGRGGHRVRQAGVVREEQPRDPSPEREALGEPSGEPHLGVPPVPSDPPQVGTDTVSVVRRVHGGGHAVYDLQVAGNRNFFAGEVLVHNCIILDDVVKDRRTARSAAYKTLWREQWQTAITSRLSAKSLVVMDHTRWLADDPIGQQLAEHGSRWRYVNIPAVVEARPAAAGEAPAPVHDPLGRKAGEWLNSARKRSPEEWAQKRKDVGEPDFWALYQGSPFPATGALFNRNHFRWWESTGDPWVVRIPNRPGPDVNLRDSFRFITVDLAASKRTAADFTVAAAWAVANTGELILLDLRRVQVEPASHWDEAVAPLFRYWDCPIYIEGSQYGTDLVYTAAREGANVQALEADTDKYTRAIPAARRMAQGQIYFPKTAHWMPEFETELKEFPAGAHDDQVDNLSYAHRIRGAYWTPPDNSHGGRGQFWTPPQPSPLDSLGGGSDLYSTPL